MICVVFLRGANAIGSRVFSPVKLAKGLARFEVVNIGAAGTFVVRASATLAAVKKAFEDALPHDADVIVRSPDEVRALIAAGAPPGRENGRVIVSVLASKPKLTPALPIQKGEPWMVRVEAVVGSFAIGQKRPVGGKWLDANAVVERAFGVRATTRVWETMERVAKALDDSAAQ